MIFFRIFLVLLFLMSGLNNFSQENVSKKNLKKSNQFYIAGTKKIEEDGDILAAEYLLKESLKYNPSNILSIRTLADLKFQSKDYSSSIEWIEKILVIDSSFRKQLLLPLIKAEIGCGHFDRAFQTLDKAYRSEQVDPKDFELFLSAIQFATDVSRKNINKNLSVKNLGSNINSTASEYFPSISSSDTLMIITRRTGNGQNEDFFGSIKLQNNWQPALPLEGKINTSFNEGGQKISTDGKWMLFTGCNYPEGYGSCDIYISQNINGNWTARKNIGDPINTEY